MLLILEGCLRPQISASVLSFLTLRQAGERQVKCKGITAEDTDCQDQTLHHPTPCPVVSTAAWEKRTAKQRRHLNLKDRWIWINQDESC